MWLRLVRWGFVVCFFLRQEAPVYWEGDAFPKTFQSPLRAAVGGLLAAFSRGGRQCKK